MAPAGPYLCSPRERRRIQPQRGCTLLDEEEANLEILFSHKNIPLEGAVFARNRCRTAGAKMIVDGCGYKGEAPIGQRYNGNPQWPHRGPPFVARGKGEEFSPSGAAPFFRARDRSGHE
jgi:hypothetical protein